MKLTFKLALVGVAIGASSVAFGQAAAPNPALDACHATIARDVAKFRADLNTAKKEHDGTPGALRHYAAVEANILNHEKLVKHETLANCQAENARLQANDALLKSAIAMGRCHHAVQKDVLLFRKDLAIAQKEHSDTPLVLKKYVAHEQAILAHEAALAKHETLANCQAEDKALKATNAALVNDILLGRCHKAVNTDIAAFKSLMATAKKEHSASPAVLKGLAAREASIVKHEAAIAKHETVAACQAEDKALKATDAELKNDILLGRCHADIRKQHAKINADIKTGLANKSLAAAKIAELKKHEVSIAAHEKALGTHETLAQCKAFDAQLVALEKTVAPHLK